MKNCNDEHKELTKEEAEIREIIEPICPPTTTEEMKREFVKRFLEIIRRRGFDEQ